jgi:hypothetical protein
MMDMGQDGKDALVVTWKHYRTHPPSGHGNLRHNCTTEPSSATWLDKVNRKELENDRVHTRASNP